jgi:ParB family chromosome partitioning protein
MIEELKNIDVNDLKPFPNNPFAVREDYELQKSIGLYGVISPVVVRPIKKGGYEIISGHRRTEATKQAGIDFVPAFIRKLDDNAAVIALVDSNMHREQILPSEKAHAYKMKLEAISRQGKRSDLSSCGQVVHKSRDMVAEQESGRQVQRYIRLTELTPQLLQLVDENRIALTPAVELSYLTKTEQADLFETIDSEDRTPNLSQSQRMRRLSADGRLDMDTIFNIMTEEKANQKEQIKLKTENIKSFFPKSYSLKQMEETILKLLAQWQRNREQNRNAR